MNVYWIFVPVTVALSSFLFIDARNRRLRGLGFVLLFGGLAAVLAIVARLAFQADARAEECAAQRGVMAAGNCWIDGKKQ